MILGSVRRIRLSNTQLFIFEVRFAEGLFVKVFV